MQGKSDWRGAAVTCDHCGKVVTAGSLRSHLETQHNVYRSLVLNRELSAECERDPVVYKSSLPSVHRGIWECPFPECVGTAKTRWNLRRHFNERHSRDLVDVPGEGILPKCELCGMQTNFAYAPRHEQSQYCQQTTTRRRQHGNAVGAARALEESFSAYGVELETVESFKYLGRVMRYDDNDAEAVRTNLRKARATWGRLSKVTRSENASSRVCGMFYKATVQAVLLFGSESWSVTPAILSSLEGFHVRAARRMAGMMPTRDTSGKWEYPSSGEVLEKVGLYTIDEYVNVRRNTILRFVSKRPIYELCRGAERMRGTGMRQYWWEQSMELEGTSPAAATVEGLGDFAGE